MSDTIAVFLHEHCCCGVVASSVEGQYISMACDCGATIMHLLEPGAPVRRSVLDHHRGGHHEFHRGEGTHQAEHRA